ncbi:hypothetical protein CROQUDRAFT_55199, partial [Cronartium quercuum f. sp. fusiforme G11]
NLPHQDHDHTRYSFGMFCRIKQDTGELYELGSEETLGDVKGAKFVIEEFGIEVAFDRCNGIIEMLWDTKMEHYSTPSISVNAKGEVIDPMTSPITRFGSSCQISEALVKRIVLLEKNKTNQGMLNEEWEKYRLSHVKSYEEEVSFKLLKLEAHRFFKAEAREKAKLNKPCKLKLRFKS